MTLSMPTLLVTNVYVLVLLGVLMLFAWARGSREAALGFLCLMLWSGALGLVIGSLRGRGMDALPIVLGNVLVHVCYAMGWTAMRAFSGRRVFWSGVWAGSVLWLLACLIPAFYGSLAARIQLSSLVIVSYTVLAGYELWRSRNENQVSLAALFSLFGLHSAFYVGRFFLDRSLPFAGESHGIDFAAFLLLETLLYSIGLTFAATAMVQQRTERRYRQASLTDSLTGIGNRRSFVEDSENMLRHCQVQHRPVTLLLCDMDNFKQLNDRHGHQAGDHALVAFCDVTRMRLRKGDIFGRLGGEEFACLLPDTTTEAAYQMAERIRKEFASCSRVAGVSLSISIGVASSAEAGYVLDSLIALADKGLYEAKGLGKNRSVISQPV